MTEANTHSITIASCIARPFTTFSQPGQHAAIRPRVDMMISRFSIPVLRLLLLLHRVRSLLGEFTQRILAVNFRHLKD